MYKMDCWINSLIAMHSFDLTLEIYAHGMELHHKS